MKMISVKCVVCSLTALLILTAVSEGATTASKRNEIVNCVGLGITEKASGTDEAAYKAAIKTAMGASLATCISGKGVTWNPDTMYGDALKSAILKLCEATDAAVLTKVGACIRVTATAGTVVTECSADFADDTKAKDNAFLCEQEKKFSKCMEDKVKAIAADSATCPPGNRDAYAKLFTGASDEVMKGLKCGDGGNSSNSTSAAPRVGSPSPQTMNLLVVLWAVVFTLAAYKWI